MHNMTDCNLASGLCDSSSTHSVTEKGNITYSTRQIAYLCAEG